jgi:hypothetical protein
MTDLKLAYPIHEIDGKATANFRVEGIEETFHVAEEHGECILYTDLWHEHLATIEDVRLFLDDLFKGIVEIVVKYRGRMPVSHAVKVITDEGERVVSRTGNLVSPIWRKKTIKTHKYKLANKAL